MDRTLNQRVGVVGIGKMGKCIVRELPRCEKLFLVDKTLTPEMEKLAQKKNAILTTDYNVLKEADIIIFVLPGDESIDFARKFGDVCNNTFIINVATFIDKKVFEANIENSTVCYIKIIGEAGEIEQGNIPAVIIQKDSDSNEKELLNSLFGQFGDMIFSENEFYNEINNMVSAEIIKSVLKMEDVLKQNNVPSRIIEIAINNVMRGTCRTYPWDENDHFINKVRAN